MPACHAGGHEFESRTHRKAIGDSDGFLFYIQNENNEKDRQNGVVRKD